MFEALFPMPQRPAQSKVPVVAIESLRENSKSTVGPGLYWACLAALLSLYTDFDRSMVGTLDGLEGESWVTAEGHPIATEGTRESLFLQAMLRQSCSQAQRLPS